MNDNTSNQTTDTSSITPASNWIKINDGKFICSECENESIPETTTPDGIIPAVMEVIKSKFIENPNSKIVTYGICPICGMEYEFRYLNNELYLEPSSMMK